MLPMGSVGNTMLSLRYRICQALPIPFPLIQQKIKPISRLGRVRSARHFSSLLALIMAPSGAISRLSVAMKSATMELDGILTTPGKPREPDKRVRLPVWVNLCRLRISAGRLL